MTNNDFCKKNILQYLGNDHPELIFFDSIDSTNNYAKELIAKNQAVDGMCICADEQTAGRGRQGRPFFSPPHSGIYFTLIRDVNKMQDPVILKTTIAACVAEYETLADVLGVHASIKWVNDLFYNGKKISGILTEAIDNFIIIGIGINCSTSNFPTDIQNVAGAIENDSEDEEEDIDRSKIAATLWKKLMYWINRTSSKELVDIYRQHSFLIGKNITFTMGHTEHNGLVENIDDDGALVVIDKSNGEKMILNTGEVHLTSWN